MLENSSRKICKIQYTEYNIKDKVQQCSSIYIITLKDRYYIMRK